MDLMTLADDSKPTCGVCGKELTDDWFVPPTFVMVQDGVDRDGLPRMRPTLSKPIRMDETGAMCWCPQEGK